MEESGEWKKILQLEAAKTLAAQWVKSTATPIIAPCDFARRNGANPTNGTVSQGLVPESDALSSIGGGGVSQTGTVLSEDSVTEFKTALGIPAAERPSRMGLPLPSQRSKKRDQIISVDLGGCQTKAVHLQRKGANWTLVNFALIDAPPADKGRDAATLAQHFQAVVTALGNPRTKSLTVALGVDETILRQIELPMMAPEDVRQMLRLNSKNYLQQELTDYVFDAFYLPPREMAAQAEGGKAGSQQKYKVIVTGAPRKLIDNVTAAAKTAGLVLDSLSPSLIGPANAFECVEPDAFNKEVVGLVDVGFRHTSIIVLDAGELVLNRVVNLGGERLTQGLAEAMGINPAEAEGIKIGMSGEIQTTLEAVINPLGRELRASLDFFEHQHDKPISQVFVSGGSARNEIIIQALQTELMVPCRNWNPARFLQGTLSADRQAEIDQLSPQFSVAVGSAAASF